MTIEEAANQLGWECLAGVDGTGNQVTGCYVGDLLSWVMSRAQSGDLFVTVMGNVNAVAVAVLTDAAGIVLTDGAALDDDARRRANQQGMPIYASGVNSYETAVAIARQVLK